MDPLSTIDFIITRFRLAKQKGDETYSKLFGDMKDMKNSWDKAVAQQEITTGTRENVVRQEITYTPTSPSYAPYSPPTTPNERPNLRIKKKIYCLYRSHAHANRACLSPWLYRSHPTPEDRPILPSFRASTLRKKPLNFRRAKFCLCRSAKSLRAVLPWEPLQKPLGPAPAPSPPQHPGEPQMAEMPEGQAREVEEAEDDAAEEAEIRLPPCM